MRNKLLWLALVVVAIIATGAYFYPKALPTRLGALVGPDIYDAVRFHDGVTIADSTNLGVTGNLDVDGVVTGDGQTTLTGFTWPTTTVTTSTTATVAQSGTTFLASGTGYTVTLPAATSTTDGVWYRFAVGAAFATSNFVIDSAEGDNIEGTLIVAGAVVDCDAEDQIDFVADGENIGDYVVLYTDGTQWLIEDSGALTTAKLTCTDPS